MVKKGYKQTEEHKKNISLALQTREKRLGYVNSPETRRKMSLARMGKIPYNKGKNKFNCESLKKTSKTLMEKKNKGGTRYYWRKIARQTLTMAGINWDKKHIHHINGNYKDNRIKNLLVLSCLEHTKLHHKQGDLKK